MQINTNTTSTKATRLSAQSFSSALTVQMREANGGRGGIDAARLPQKMGHKGHPVNLNSDQQAGGMRIVAAGEDMKGHSCDEVCAVEHLRCEKSQFEHINSCEMLRGHFSECTSCKGSVGLDQPAYVALSAPQAASPGVCVFQMSNEPFSCGGKWTHTRRLCPCR